MKPPDRLAEIFRSVPELEGAEIVASLSAGPVSDKWLLNCAAGQQVLRVDRPFAATLGLDRRAELQSLAVLAEVGYVAEPTYSDAARGILLSEFVPGLVWTQSNFEDPDCLVALGHCLRQLHSLSLSGPKFRLDERLQCYADLLATPQAREWSAEAQGLLDELAEQAGPAVLCHNDVVLGNIVATPGLRLIDWEFAAAGDPLFELAGVLEYHELSGQLAEVFVSAYRDSSDDLSNFLFQSRLKAWRRVFRLTQRLWFALIRVPPRNITL